MNGDLLSKQILRKRQLVILHMQNNLKLLKLLFVAEIITLILSKPAHAYIDPGTGALILQIIAGIGVGIMFYFRKIVHVFRRIFKRSNRARP